MKFFNLEKSEKPILTRWYLRRGKNLGIKVHKLKGDDTFHNHPWWAISFILGWYREEFEGQPGVKHLRVLLNIVSPWRRHKVHVKKPVYTFFINFWRVNDQWSYGETTKPWRGADTDPKEEIKAAIAGYRQSYSRQLEASLSPEDLAYLLRKRK